MCVYCISIVKLLKSTREIQLDKAYEFVFFHFSSVHVLACKHAVSANSNNIHRLLGSEGLYVLHFIIL